MSDLTEFIKKYGKPYDPETDDYDVPPFQKNIDNASKSSKIYNMHMYWTKQDPYVVRQYIEHYTKPGDIVLDAFCGTGMTGVAAMMCGRHAILLEISPACIHIARNYTTPIDPNVLYKAYQELKAKVEPEIKPLYKTKCHNCGNSNAQIANTILSDVYKCPRCGVDVLYAGDGRWERMKKGEKLRRIRCGNCGYEFSKAKAEFVRVEPIEIRVDCSVCKTKGQKKAKPLDEEDWKRYIEIEGGERFINELGSEALEEMKEEKGLDKLSPKEPPYWYPKDVKFFGDEPKRNYKRGITHPYQMFSRRNLIALSILWHYIGQIESDQVADKMRLLFTATLYNVSSMYMWRMTGKGGLRKGTLYIPSLIQDMNVFKTFQDKSGDLFRAAIEMGSFKPVLSLGAKSDARRLESIPDNSIDFAYYDPPYGKNINYSELNIMWEAWLDEFTDIHKEILENEFQGKSRETYEAMMLSALKEAYRVLKPERRLTMVYSYSDPSMYRTIQNIAHKAGFIDEGEVLHVNSTMKTVAQMDSDVTQQRFLVFNFKKPREIQKEKAIRISEDIQYEVIKVVQEFLIKHPGQTRDYIYDQVIKRLFTSVRIQKFDLDEILKNFFRKVGNEWYAPGTLLTRKEEEKPQTELFTPRLLEHPEKEVVLRLQEFLEKYGKVPYSELREFFLRKINIPIDGHFDQLVKENFIIEEGKVRLPTLQEQRRMQDITIRYQTRMIKRFLEGKFDKRVSDTELCEWMEFCYKNGLYREGVRLFALINQEGMDQETFRKIKKIAEVCRIKSE